MSGTSAGSRPSFGAGAGLPTPKIELTRARDTFQMGINPNAASFSVARTSEKVAMAAMPVLSVVDIPKALFDLDLRLELLVYKRRQKSKGGSGYHHPTHTATGTSAAGNPSAPLLPKSRFRGGAHTGGPEVITEWEVTKNGQLILVDSLANFVRLEQILYRDIAGNIKTIPAFVQTNTAATGNRVPTQAFGYTDMFHPVYFRFRYSIKDKADQRGQRITGPETNSIVFAPVIHPFTLDEAVSQTLGAACVQVNPRYDYEQWNCTWATRLPG